MNEPIFYEGANHYSLNAGLFAIVLERVKSSLKEKDSSNKPTDRNLNTLKSYFEYGLKGYERIQPKEGLPELSIKDYSIAFNVICQVFDIYKKNQSQLDLTKVPGDLENFIKILETKDFDNPEKEKFSFFVDKLFEKKKKIIASHFPNI